MAPLQKYRRLILDSQKAGALDTPPRDTPQLRTLADQARLALAEIDRNYPTYTPVDKARTLEIYDIIHRIAHRRPAPHTLLTRRRTDLINAWRNGDTTLTETHIAAIIQQQLHTAPSTLTPQLLLWYTRTLTAWCTQLTPPPPKTQNPPLTPRPKTQNPQLITINPQLKTNNPKLTAHTPQLKIKILLREDLSPILGKETQKRLKQQWLRDIGTANTY